MLEYIRKRFDNRLTDSEAWTEFYNNHEPDVAELLSIVDKYKSENEKLTEEAEQLKSERKERIEMIELMVRKGFISSEQYLKVVNEVLEKE